MTKSMHPILSATIFMENKLALSVFLSLLLLSGCAPYPQTIYSAPKIDGVLTNKGLPIGNAEVLIGGSIKDENPCKDGKIVSRTNEKGEFSVPSKTETEIFYSFINPPELVGRVNNLCFQVIGQPPIFGGQYLTKTDKESVITATCDIATPKKTLFSVKLLTICS